MKSKKTFRVNFLFLLEFRLFFLLSVSFFPASLWFFVGAFTEPEIKNKLFALFGGILATWLSYMFFKVYVIPTLIPVGFGKLIITDEGIAYRCLFKKPSYISWSDCKFCGIESYHSDVADLYRTGRRYVYFSTKPIPKERRNKLDMMKNDNELIKFFPVTKKLCNEILLHKSVSDIRHALFQNEIKW